MLFLEEGKLVFKTDNMPISDKYPQELRARAEKLTRSGKFRCGEAVVRAFVDVTDAHYLRPLVAMASGLTAVMAATMVLGMAFGTDKARNGSESGCCTRCMDLAKELQEKYNEMHGPQCCASQCAADCRDEAYVRASGDAAELLGSILAREWYSAACCPLSGH